MMKKATAVLDFGTSKVLVLLAEESAYQKVTITSAGMAQYDGFMNGEWNAPSEVSDAIASAVEAAENKVGTHIKEVYVGVPGEFVRVYVIESSVALQGADPKVTSADVEKLQRQRGALHPRYASDNYPRTDCNTYGSPFRNTRKLKIWTEMEQNLLKWVERTGIIGYNKLA